MDDQKWEQEALPGMRAHQGAIPIPELLEEDTPWENFSLEHVEFVEYCCKAGIELQVAGDALGVNLLAIFSEDPDAQREIKRWYAIGLIRSRTYFAAAALKDQMLMRLLFSDYVERMTGTS